MSGINVIIALGIITSTKVPFPGVLLILIDPLDNNFKRSLTLLILNVSDNSL